MSVAETPSALDIDDLRAPSPAWNAAVEIPAEAAQLPAEQGVESMVEVEVEAAVIEAVPSIEPMDDVVSEAPAALNELVEPPSATSEVTQPDLIELPVETEAQSLVGANDLVETETVEPMIEVADFAAGEVVVEDIVDAFPTEEPVVVSGEGDWGADARVVDDAIASLPDRSDPAEGFSAFAANAAPEAAFEQLAESDAPTTVALAPEEMEAAPVLVEEFDDEPLTTDPDAVIALSPFDHATGERLAVVLEGASTSLDALVQATDAQATALEVLEVLGRRIRSGELQVTPAGTSEESVLASILAALLSHRP